MQRPRGSLRVARLAMTSRDAGEMEEETKTRAGASRALLAKLRIFLFIANHDVSSSRTGTLVLCIVVSPVPQNRDSHSKLLRTIC